MAWMLARSEASRITFERTTSQWLGVRRFTTASSHFRCLRLSATRYFDTVPCIHSSFLRVPSWQTGDLT